jgi:predicted oxidoreductase
MRIDGMGKGEAAKFVRAALDLGANFFDHADIYGAGACEELFADALKGAGAARGDVFIQTKCGIVPGKMFDFSKKHIIASAEASLKRLKTDYVDAFLLHRPDALVEPEEVAEAFEELRAAGKALHFGVSNHKPSQLQLLQKYIKQPIVANQLQFGVAHAQMVTQGLRVNMLWDGSEDHDGSVLDYCRLNDITIQAWSPLQHGYFDGVFLGDEKFPELNAAIDEIAGRHGVSNTTVAFAWILRHPAKIQPVTGTTSVARLTDCVKAADVSLSREEWYAIYCAAGNELP